MPHYFLDLKDVEPFKCEECGGTVSEYLEVEYISANDWICRWKIGCAFYGPYRGGTEEALEWLIEKPLKHYKTHDQGPYDLRKTEMQSIVNDLKEYLGDQDAGT